MQNRPLVVQRVRRGEEDISDQVYAGLTPAERMGMMWRLALVEYLVVGAYALAAHGLPRATGDIDLWVRPGAANASRVESALLTFGAPADRFSRADFESDDLILQIGVPPGRVDVITSIEAVTFDEAWPNRWWWNWMALP